MALNEKQKHKWKHDSNAAGYFTRCTQCGIIISYPNPLPESICTHHKEERPSATEPVTHPVTAQVPEVFTLEQVRQAMKRASLKCLWRGSRGDFTTDLIAEALVELVPKQKTPEERVVVKHMKHMVGCHFWNVFLDDKNMSVQFLEEVDANRYAAGLRAKLAGGSHE